MAMLEKSINISPFNSWIYSNKSPNKLQQAEKFFEKSKKTLVFFIQMLYNNNYTFVFVLKIL